jgi:hypothetical protein
VIATGIPVGGTRKKSPFRYALEFEVAGSVRAHRDKRMRHIALMPHQPDLEQAAIDRT